MAKMIMKKSKSRRMSMKGGRDWKICRRLLRGKEGMRRGGVGPQELSLGLLSGEYGAWHSFLTEH